MRPARSVAHPRFLCPQPAEPQNVSRETSPAIRPDKLARHANEFQIVSRETSLETTRQGPAPRPGGCTLKATDSTRGSEIVSRETSPSPTHRRNRARPRRAEGIHAPSCTQAVPAMTTEPRMTHVATTRRHNVDAPRRARMTTPTLPKKKLEEPNATDKWGSGGYRVRLRSRLGRWPPDPHP